MAVAGRELGPVGEVAQRIVRIENPVGLSAPARQHLAHGDGSVLSLHEGHECRIEERRKGGPYHPEALVLDGADALVHALLELVAQPRKEVHRVLGAAHQAKRQHHAAEALGGLRRRDVGDEPVDLEADLGEPIGKGHDLLQTVVVHLLSRLLLQEGDQALVLVLPEAQRPGRERVVGPLHAEAGDAVAPAQRVERLDVVARGTGVEKEVRLGPLAGMQQAVHVAEEGADLPGRAGRGRDADGRGDGLHFHDVRDHAPEFVEAADHVHRLVDFDWLLSAVGRYKLAFLLSRGNPLHVLLKQLHVADAGFHQAGLLLHAFGGHLEARHQLFGCNQFVSAHVELLSLFVCGRCLRGHDF